MSLTIRRIQPGEGDLYKVARLESLKESPSAFATTYDSALQRDVQSWTAQADQSATGPNRCTCLALVDKHPIGLGAIYRDQTNARNGELIQMWVSPTNRGKRIGINILDFLMDWAQKNAFQSIYATVLAGNDKALQFYLTYGFAHHQNTYENKTLVSTTLRKEVGS